jgi:hypothetical protein
MAPPVKVLFTGDVRGDLPALMKKLEAVNKKSGPFAAAFVVGALLDEAGQAKGLPLVAPPPLPVYFLGAGEGGRQPMQACHAGTCMHANMAWHPSCTRPTGVCSTCL